MTSATAADFAGSALLASLSPEELWAAAQHFTLELPDVQERLLQQGAFATSTSPEEAARRIHSEIAKWAKVIDEANIKPE
jgi:tripartite-type tricarboxylate transporter receptor subunit TctC